MLPDVGSGRLESPISSFKGFWFLMLFVLGRVGEQNDMNHGCFTLWPSKSRGRGIEWPNFVESPKKWAENNLKI